MLFEGLTMYLQMIKVANIFSILSGGEQLVKNGTTAYLAHARQMTAVEEGTMTIVLVQDSKKPGTSPQRPIGAKASIR